MNYNFKNIVIEKSAKNLCDLIEGIESIDEKVDALNMIREALHNVSPLKSHPADCVLWVKEERVFSNSYNPNSVAPPEDKLLATSMIEDGITMPTYVNPEDDNFETIDGFHRTRQIKNNSKIKEATHGYVPVTVSRVDKRSISNRMASTIRHNRARGSHSIDLMVNIVAELTKAGMGDAWIMKHIGMDADEILRLKQLSGLAELFKNREFTTANNPI